jgi:ANTAR domain
VPFPGRPATVSAMTDADDRADFTAVIELAEAFTALVDALSSGDGHPAMNPQRIVDVAAACVPASRDVALSVAEGNRARLLAATGDLPRDVDRIRKEVGHGPVLDLVDTNDLVISNDLAADLRWPVFGRRVVEQLGIRSVAGYRLYLAPRVRAALTFYSDWPHAFDDLAIATGSIFAAYCSLVVFTETVLGTRLSTHRAAEVHREIGVAVGILMATQEIDTGTAFRRLHRAARRLHRDLPEVARHVVGHRRLPER